MMKKVYKKSSDTDQSNQSNIDKQISNLIVTPKNTTVKAINCTVSVNLDQFEKHNAELTTTEIDYIKLFANGGTINCLLNSSVQQSINHLVKLGVLKLNSHTCDAIYSERDVQN